jgi:hypothetical protein
MTTELKDMNTIELMEYALTLEDDTLDINTKIAVERVLNIRKVHTNKKAELLELTEELGYIQEADALALIELDRLLKGEAG